MEPAEAAAAGNDPQPLAGEAKEIPQSGLLAEAEAESLGDLMSRDPEGFGKQDMRRIIEAQRAQRVKWEAMEKENEGKPKRERTKADATAVLKKASGSAGDLGL